MPEIVTTPEYKKISIRFRKRLVSEKLTLKPDKCEKMVFGWANPQVLKVNKNPRKKNYSERLGVSPDRLLRFNQYIEKFVRLSTWEFKLVPPPIPFFGSENCHTLQPTDRCFSG